MNNIPALSIKTAVKDAFKITRLNSGFFLGLCGLGFILLIMWGVVALSPNVGGRFLAGLISFFCLVAAIVWVVHASWDLLNGREAAASVIMQKMWRSSLPVFIFLFFFYALYVIITMFFSDVLFSAPFLRILFSGFIMAMVWAVTFVVTPLGALEGLFPVAAIKRNLRLISGHKAKLFMFALAMNYASMSVMELLAVREVSVAGAFILAIFCDILMVFTVVFFTAIETAVYCQLTKTRMA